MKWDEILLNRKVWDWVKFYWILWTFIKVLDKVCPTFSHFSWHNWKLMKLNQYLTVFPSHFNNIFLKSFKLLQNLMRNCEILWKLTQFHEISWYFIGIILCFRSVAMYFVDFQFPFRCFWKLTAKFRFHLNRFKILKFQTWQWRKLKKSIWQLPMAEHSTHIPKAKGFEFST